LQDLTTAFALYKAREKRKFAKPKLTRFPQKMAWWRSNFVHNHDEFCEGLFDESLKSETFLVKAEQAVNTDQTLTGMSLHRAMALYIWKTWLTVEKSSKFKETIVQIYDEEKAEFDEQRELKNAKKTKKKRKTKQTYQKTRTNYQNLESKTCHLLKRSRNS